MKSLIMLVNVSCLWDIEGRRSDLKSDGTIMSSQDRFPSRAESLLGKARARERATVDLRSSLRFALCRCYKRSWLLAHSSNK